MSLARTVPNSEAPIRPSRSLAGRVALVTGAGSAGDDIGNGRAISILLAEDGASVICIDIDLSAAEKTAALIKNEGKGNALAHQGNVTNEHDCQRIVVAALALYGRIDILVNNVGSIGARGAAPEVDLDDWEQSLKLNVTSMMLMAKYAIPAMRKNDPDDGNIRGSIVNMGSVAGLQGGTPSLLYPTSKGAVVNMTRAMAAQHAGDGIRVNCVCPGMLYKPMMYRMNGGMDSDMRESRRKRSLLQTEGNAWDCAGAVRYLAGNEGRWITGTILTVDAGATCAQLVSASS